MMSRNANIGTNIANAVISGIVLVCGVAVSVIIAVLFRKVSTIIGIDTSGTEQYSAYASAPVWSLGFGFMVPGLIGVIASLAQQKGGYITQMVFCILSLVIMGIFFVVGVLALSTWSMFDYKDCISVLNTCSCLNGFSPTISLGSSCEDINALSSLSLGCCAMIVLGWVFTLVTCVTGGMLACSRQVHPGVIIQPNGQSAVTVMHVNNQVGQPMQGGYGGQPDYGPPPGYGAQPGYGPQTGYGPQPGYVTQPDYGTGPVGDPVPPIHPVEAKAHM